MDEENRINYYAVIPAFVRYDKHLKANEKLLYGEITSLCNKNGYCYAQNRYFAKLYNVTNSTISKWLSHLQQLGYIQIEIERNYTKEVINRHIYIVDIPYCQKKPYPYCSKEQYPMVKKDKDNNIDYKIDDLFNLIINRNSKIPKEFYKILERLELLYTTQILSYLQKDKQQMLKEIIYTLYELYNSNFRSLLSKISREPLITLYFIAREYMPQNFLNYYKKVIINKYINDTS